MTLDITAKEVAQTFVLNDIIIHEFILDAISKTDNFVEKTKLTNLSKGDLVRIVMNYAAKEQEMKLMFHISDSEILHTIKNDYKNEIEMLYEKLNQKK